MERDRDGRHTPALCAASRARRAPGRGGRKSQMRISLPSFFTGTLGSLAQLALHGVNYLRVLPLHFADADSDAGVAYSNTYQSNAVAAEHSHLQLWHQGSTHVVYVDGFWVTCGTAGS